MVNKIKKIQSLIAKVSLSISAVAMASVGLSIFLSIFCRFVLKIGLMWVDQYARYMLIWSVFLAANVLVYRNTLMRVDFLDASWPDGMKRVREALYTMIFIIMLCLLTYYGLQQAINYLGVELMGIRIDKFWVYLSIPIGSFLMLVQYLLNLIYAFLSGGEREGDIE